MLKPLPLLVPIGAVVFTIAWAVLGAISPGYRLFDLVIATYSPISQPISGLGLGVTAPFMNTAFVVCGLLLSVGIVGLIPAARSRLERVALALIACLGLGMIVDGVFTLESVMLHLVGFLLAIPVPAVGLVLLGISLRPRHRAAAIAIGILGVLTMGLFAAFMITFDPYSAGDNTGVSGLLQRTLVTVVLGTVTVIALRFRARRGAVTSAPAAAGAARGADVV